jgi:hypothetical protein
MYNTSAPAQSSKVYRQTDAIVSRYRYDDPLYVESFGTFYFTSYSVIKKPADKSEVQ